MKKFSLLFVFILFVFNLKAAEVTSTVKAIKKYSQEGNFSNYLMFKLDVSLPCPASPAVIFDGYQFAIHKDSEESYDDIKNILLMALSTKKTVKIEYSLPSSSTNAVFCTVHSISLGD